jgi:hypothetical protein
MPESRAETIRKPCLVQLSVHVQGFYTPRRETNALFLFDFLWRRLFFVYKNRTSFNFKTISAPCTPAKHEF